MPTSLRSRCGASIVVVFSVACGGSGSSPGNPTAPSSSGGGTPAVVTVSIVADRGSQSFSPNPATPGQNLIIAWRNTDGTTHRIVANDGSFDTGDIVPGATSRTLSSPTAGANYHCSIHPTMLGAINASGGDAPPPCTGLYCG